MHKVPLVESLRVIGRGSLNWVAQRPIAPRFPWLLKFLDCEGLLSVQVHPDDNYARLHEPGSFGKCEMWYVVHADSHAGILLGLKPGVTRETLRPAFEKGESKELLNLFRPVVGEAMEKIYAQA